VLALPQLDNGLDPAVVGVLDISPLHAIAIQQTTPDTYQSVSKSVYVASASAAGVCQLSSSSTSSSKDGWQQPALPRDSYGAHAHRCCRWCDGGVPDAADGGVQERLAGRTAPTKNTHTDVQGPVGEQSSLRWREPT
jgi:hypothetical protein